MIFDSSLLKEQTSNDIKASTQDLMENENNPTYLRAMLEFNEDIHRICVEDQINYYRMLKEASNGECTDLVLQEGIVSGIRDFLANIINKILEFLKKIFNVIRGNFDKNTVQGFNNAKKNAARHDASSEDDGLYKFFNHKSLVEFDFANFPTPCVQRITGYIADLCNGKYREAEDEKEFAFHALYTRFKRSFNISYDGEVKDIESFREFCNTAYFTSTSKRTSFAEFRDFYNTRRVAENPNEINKAFANIMQELEKCKGIVARSNDIDAAYRDKANALVSQLKEIVDAWVWFVNKCYNEDMKMARYYSNVVDRKRAFNMRSDLNESSTMHGEKFDGDTIFDNEDMRDFNSTEWLDLTLETEIFTATYEALETRRIIAYNEAVIMSESSGVIAERKLIAMREAEENKLGAKFQQILENIRQIISQFIAQFQEQINISGKYIKANKAVVDQPFKLTQEMSSTGDILNGIGRVKDPTDVKPFNYDSMKEDLKDDKGFFEKYVKPSLTGACRAQWSGDISIADFCKAYFGASMTDKEKYKPVQLPLEKLQGAKNEIVDYLQNNKVIAGIKKEQSTLEAEAKKAMQSMGQTENPSAGSQPATNDNNQTAEAPKNESYFSELYLKPFNEVEFEGDDKDGNDGGPASGNNNTGNDEKKESSADKTKAFRTYLSVYRSVMSAKITAAAFIRSEFFQIIKAHVKSYKGSKGAAADNNAQQNSQPNNAQTQQPQQ